MKILDNQLYKNIIKLESINFMNKWLLEYNVSSGFSYKKQSWATKES